MTGCIGISSKLLDLLGTQGVGDSRQHSKGDQRGSQAENRYRAANVTDGRQRHLVSACELQEQNKVWEAGLRPHPVVGRVSEWMDATARATALTL